MRCASAKRLISESLDEALRPGRAAGASGCAGPVPGLAGARAPAGGRVGTGLLAASTGWRGTVSSVLPTNCWVGHWPGRSWARSGRPRRVLSSASAGLPAQVHGVPAFFVLV